MSCMLGTWSLSWSTPRIPFRTMSAWNKKIFLLSAIFWLIYLIFLTVKFVLVRIHWRRKHFTNKSRYKYKTPYQDKVLSSLNPTKLSFQLFLYFFYLYPRFQIITIWIRKNWERKLNHLTLLATTLGITRPGQSQSVISDSRTRVCKY